MTKRGYTSIRINPNLWKRVKIKAIECDMGVSDLVEGALSMWLEIFENREKGEEHILSILKKRLEGSR